MEEKTKFYRKNSGLKGSEGEPALLFAECQQHVIKLNQQLGVYMEGQRAKQLQFVLPSITTLDREITELKENISHETTPQKKLNERKQLVPIKQAMLERIKGHSKQIESLKKKFQTVTIICDQLAREFEENRMAIQNYGNRQEMQNNLSDLGQKLMDESRNSVSTVFVTPLACHTRRYQSNLQDYQIHNESDSKWSRVDKILRKISVLSSDGLSENLLKLAKQQRCYLKGVLKNYEISDKMGEYMRSGEVKREWLGLTANVL